MNHTIPVQILNRSQSASIHLRLAAQAAAEAGEIIQHYHQHGVQMRSKAGEESFNLVSNADEEAERAIVKRLVANFPDHEMVGEEQTLGNIAGQHVWIVDPLDGTNNFAHRIPQFSVSIAYYHQGIAECGVVHNPVLGDWYWAERGQGAFCNGRRMKVSNASRLDQAMVGVGFYYDRGRMMEATLRAIADFFRQQIHGVRRFGSAALDLCYVADGLLDVFFEYQLSPWDFAAARLILEEAGGQISDGRGAALPLAKTSVLASNRRLHSAATDIVACHHLHNEDS